MMRERPKMPPVSEEMKQWSAMLKTEVSGWPQITTKPMFGMMGLYRRKDIFGGLPVTRGFDEQTRAHVEALHALAMQGLEARPALAP